MFMTTPRDPERFSLRLLLLHRKNMHSFEDIPTVSNVLHPTFSDTAGALDLLHDDAHYERCLEEAAHFQLPAELRALFSYLLAFCDVAHPQSLFDRFKADMRTMCGLCAQRLHTIRRGILAYYDIYDKLAILQYDLSTRIVPPAQPRPEDTTIPTDYESH
ncbi:hypothetical protein Y032_0426g1243 [Ancylostoma ceylanicum]|nr:hypothetical protein Y032_0426g1243 [Ancylostoma ceylanicum]